ncbi:MAG: NUDIX hydrolase [Candidatus Peribacteraceae bacterium]|nr:NUDIX hydrolase [Candidatus Peribacteraceae bacterium]
MKADQDIILLAKKLQKEAETDGIDKLLSGAVVMIKNQILIVRRSLQDDFLPGYFEIPGGGVEKGETILEALERELFEETSLKIDSIIGYVGSFNAVSLSQQKVRQFNFLVTPTSVDVRCSEEHSDFLWSDQIDDSMTMLDSTKQVLLQARRVQDNQGQ